MYMYMYIYDNDPPPPIFVGQVLPCQAHRLAQLAALLLARFHAWSARTLISNFKI